MLIYMSGWYGLQKEKQADERKGGSGEKADKEQRQTA